MTTYAAPQIMTTAAPTQYVSGPTLPVEYTTGATQYVTQAPAVQSVVMQQPAGTIVGRSSVVMENVSAEFRATHEQLPTETMLGSTKQVRLDSITEKHMEMARVSE